MIIVSAWTHKEEGESNWKYISNMTLIIFVVQAIDQNELKFLGVHFIETILQSDQEQT